MKPETLSQLHTRFTGSPFTWGALVVAGSVVLTMYAIKTWNSDNFRRMQQVFGESAVHFTAPLGPPVLSGDVRSAAERALHELLVKKSSVSRQGNVMFSLTPGTRYEDCVTRTLVASRMGVEAWVGHIKSCTGKPDQLSLH